MKKLFACIPVLLCVLGCYPKDNYTGEPLLREYYTIDGKLYTWEDWGYLSRGFLGQNFNAFSQGSGVHVERVNDSVRISVFSLDTPNFSYFLTDSTSLFYDGQVYHARKNSCKLIKPEQARVESGWYSFTRKREKPYDSYVMRFEFECVNGQGQIIKVRNGILEMGRRYALQHTDPKHPYIIVEKSE